MAMWWKANMGIIFYGQQHPQICLIIWMSPSKKCKQGHLLKEISKTLVAHSQLITWGCFQFLKDRLQPPKSNTPLRKKKRFIRLPQKNSTSKEPWILDVQQIFLIRNQSFMTSKSTSNLIHRVGFPCLCVWGLANSVPGTSSLGWWNLWQHHAREPPKPASPLQDAW